MQHFGACLCMPGGVSVPAAFCRLALSDTATTQHQARSVQSWLCTHAAQLNGILKPIRVLAMSVQVACATRCYYTAGPPRLPRQALTDAEHQSFTQPEMQLHAQPWHCCHLQRVCWHTARAGPSDRPKSLRLAVHDHMPVYAGFRFSLNAISPSSRSCVLSSCMSHTDLQHELTHAGPALQIDMILAAGSCWSCRNGACYRCLPPADALSTHVQCQTSACTGRGSTVATLTCTLVGAGR